MKFHRARMLLGLLAVLSPLHAETYADLKTALTAALPSGQKVYKTDIRLSADQAQYINTHWGGGFQKGDPFTWYYTKDAAGTLTAAAVEMVEVLDKYSAYHRWVVGFKADKSLSALTILELTNDHTYSMGKPVFQKQFAGKDSAKLQLAAGVDAVSGATESCQLLVDSIHRARYLLDQTALR